MSMATGTQTMKVGKNILLFMKETLKLEFYLRAIDNINGNLLNVFDSVPSRCASNGNGDRSLHAQNENNQYFQAISQVG